MPTNGHPGISHSLEVIQCKFWWHFATMFTMQCTLAQFVPPQKLKASQKTSCWAVVPSLCAECGKSSLPCWGSPLAWPQAKTPIINIVHVLYEPEMLHWLHASLTRQEYGARSAYRILKILTIHGAFPSTSQSFRVCVFPFPLLPGLKPLLLNLEYASLFPCLRQSWHTQGTKKLQIFQTKTHTRLHVNRNTPKRQNLHRKYKINLIILSQFRGNKTNLHIFSLLTLNVSDQPRHVWNNFAVPYWWW